MPRRQRLSFRTAVCRERHHVDSLEESAVEPLPGSGSVCLVPRYTHASIHTVTFICDSLAEAMFLR